MSRGSGWEEGRPGLAVGGGLWLKSTASAEYDMLAYLHLYLSFSPIPGFDPRAKLSYKSTSRSAWKVLTTEKELMDRAGLLTNLIEAHLYRYYPSSFIKGCQIFHLSFHLFPLRTV